MTPFLRAAAGALLAIAPIQAPAAEFFYNPADEREMFMVGDIEKGDAKRFIYAMARGVGAFRIELRSPGGHMLTGMQLGRLIRKYRLSVHAPQFVDEIGFVCDSPSDPVATGSADCQCSSACAMMWLGGVIRFGSVGLHRAYRPGPATSFGDYEDQMAGAQDVTLGYLREMRAPIWLQDAILSTSSREITIANGAWTWGSIADFSEEGLTFDSAFQEFALSHCGEGVTYDPASCYGRALGLAIREGEMERWYDTLEAYMQAFPILAMEPYLSEFDRILRDVTASEAYWDDLWLDQIGRAHALVSRGRPQVPPPDWWEGE